MPPFGGRYVVVTLSLRRHGASARRPVRAVVVVVLPLRVRMAASVGRTAPSDEWKRRPSRLLRSLAAPAAVVMAECPATRPGPEFRRAADGKEGWRRISRPFLGAREEMQRRGAVGMEVVPEAEWDLSDCFDFVLFSLFGKGNGLDLSSVLFCYFRKYLRHNGVD